MQITPSPPRRAPPSALAAEGAGESRRPAPAHEGGWGTEGHRRSSGGRRRSGGGRRTPCLALAGPAAAQLRGPGAAPRGPPRSSMGERERRGGRGGGEAAAGAGGGGGEAAVGACGRVTRQAHGPPVYERKREERVKGEAGGATSATWMGDVAENRGGFGSSGNLYGFVSSRVQNVWFCSSRLKIGPM